ncbi:MAG: phage tail tape measure protein [Oscillospiraceae bacterium]|nr:phage tail tape measure protein [Oscillospiraceae bacterium]
MSDGTVTISTDLDSSGFEAGLNSLSSLSVAAGNLIAQAVTKLVDGIVSFGTSAIQAGMDFDSAMSQLAATMGTTTDQISELEEKAKELGASTSFSATEAAEGLNILAQAGYNATEQVGMIDSVLDLAAAGATTMDNAATYLTTTLKGYCVASEDVGDMTTYYSNLIAKGATLVNTSVDELGTAMADSAANANAYSQSVETTTTALLALADGGYTGSEAATGLNRVMQSLYAPTDLAATALKSLGVSCYDEAGNARDLLDVIEDLESATADLTEEETNSYLQTILGTYGLKAYNAITTKSAEDIDELTASLIDCENAASSMAATQLDNLEGQITICKSALEGLEIAISDELSPTLSEFVQFGTDQLGVLTDAIGEGGLQGGIEAIGTVLANLLTYIGELAPSIIDTATNLIHNFCEGLKDTATTNSAATSVVGNLISAIISCAGDIWSTALVLLTSFVQGIADSVPDIMASGVDMITALLDTIEEYAPQLITSAASIISTFVTGLGSGLPDLVSKGAELLGTVVQAILDELPGVVSAAAEAVESFATGLIDNLPNVVSAAQEILPQFVSTITGSLSTLSTAAVNIMTSLGSYLQENLPTILETGLTALMELTASLRENAGVLVDGALAMIESIATGLIDSLPTLIETVPTIVSNIANIINDNAPKLLETAFNLIVQLGQGLIEAIPTLIENIPQIIQAIVDVFTAFNWLDLGSKVMTLFKNGITSMISALKGAGKDVLNSIYDAIKSLPSKLMSLGKNAGTFLKNGLSAMIGAIKSVSSNILSTIVSAISSLPSKLLTLGKNAMTFLKNGISSMISSIASTVGTIADTIVNYFMNLPSEMVSIGKNIINGLISGITSMVSSLYSSIKNALSGLVDKAKSALGINSPSKVMEEEVGVYIPSGVAVGVEKNAAVAEEAVEDMADGMVAAAADTSAYEEAGEAAAAAMADGVEAATADTSGMTLDIDAKTDALQEKLDSLTAKVSVALPDISTFLSRLEAVVALRVEEVTATITAKTNNGVDVVDTQDSDRFDYEALAKAIIQAFIAAGVAVKVNERELGRLIAKYA